MDQKDKSAPSLDFRTIALLVALLGGAYLIQSPLRSSRPGEKEIPERLSASDQAVPARLWQDPFEATAAFQKKKDGAADTRVHEDASYNFSELGNQIFRHSQNMDVGATNFQPVTILEVMTPGGSYAEDAESRRRARYATLSALTTSGYVPANAEHISYVKTHWPRAKSLEPYTHGEIPTLESMTNANDSSVVIPYEWFESNSLRKRDINTESVLVLWLSDNDFGDHPAKRIAQFNHCLRSHIKQDVESSTAEASTNVVRFKLLEPRLYSIINEPFSRNSSTNSTNVSSNYFNLANELAYVDLYSSWSTTADAVLTVSAAVTTNTAVTTNAVKSSGVETSRRFAVTNQLKELLWGGSFTNATCTDDELAEELIDELALRGIDLANGRDAVALVSEWDTFYGRALPLTFVATLKCRMRDTLTGSDVLKLDDIIARLRSGNASQPSTEPLRQLFETTIKAAQTAGSDRAALTNLFLNDFNRVIEQGWPMIERLKSFANQPTSDLSSCTNLSAGKLKHLNRQLLENAFPGAIRSNRFADVVGELSTYSSKWPSNVFRFTYLRGVDGKTPGDGGDQNSGKDTSKEKDGGDAADLVARPEGNDQLDYLPRLSDRLAEREGAYERSGRGQLKAIGVLGSDVYDKLLVLQSLRPRFTEPLFFTTDLDARMLHPRERKWSRNVIVASSFGLMLGYRLQRDILPFRDTYQTGEYLACLAALGYPPAVTNLGCLAPRRFEIGRNGAWDLSVHESSLHPLMPWQRRLRFLAGFPWVWLTVALATLAVLIWHFLHRRQKPVKGNQSHLFSLDDITDLPSLANTLKKSASLDVVSEHLKKKLRPSTQRLLSNYDGGPDRNLQRELVNDLNAIVRPTPLTGLLDELKPKASELSPETLCLLRRNPSGADLVLANRLILEDLYPLELAQVGKVRQWTICAFLVSVLVWLVLCGLVVFDHFRKGGQPFSLTQGISNWPTELLRMAAAGLAVVFFFHSRSTLFQSKKEWIRDFGLPAILTRKGVRKIWQNATRYKKWCGLQTPPESWGKLVRYLRWISITNWMTPTTDDQKEPVEEANQRAESDQSSKSDAFVEEYNKRPIRGDELCKGYNLLGFWRHRIYRLALPTVGFLVLTVAITQLFGTPFTSSRGTVSQHVEQVAVCLSFVFQTILILFVVDASRLCRRFIEHLTEAETQWPEQTCQIFHDKFSLDCTYLREYITVKVIAERSAAVGRLIFYPFLILFLTIVSRSSFFDRWNWPISLILVYGLSSLLAVYAVWQLRGAAERARTFALSRLNAKLFRALGGQTDSPRPKAEPAVAMAGAASDEGQGKKVESSSNESASTHADDPKTLGERLKILIDKIEACEEGAFAPITRQPVIRALLMPFGGAGIAALLQFLASKQ